MGMQEQLRQMKRVSPQMAGLSLEIRNQALSNITKALTASKSEILSANLADMEAARAAGIPGPILKRLKFDEHKLADSVSGVLSLRELPDPLFHVTIDRQLDAGLRLVRESCPIGVIGVIFEARPDAMIQIAGLCVKSGNCAILKGGSEALLTNRVLFRIIDEAVQAAGLPEGCLMQAEARSEISELLSFHQYVDLIIPRGSNAFVQYIMQNTKIPVLGHADGICHIYADKAADVNKSVPILVDAKSQYPAACNALETLLVHKDVAQALLPPLFAAMKDEGITLKSDAAVQAIIPCESAEEADFDREFLDLVMAVKVVDSLGAAIDHINLHGSHHTDCILTEDPEAAARFMKIVDSAGVYQNCSTRFADGFRYGLGAEVGISTGKIHARGPVGLEGLISYKYKLFGDGHIVGDYASGKRQFHFSDN